MNRRGGYAEGVARFMPGVRARGRIIPRWMMFRCMTMVMGKGPDHEIDGRAIPILYEVRRCLVFSWRPWPRPNREWTLWTVERRDVWWPDWGKPSKSDRWFELLALVLTWGPWISLAPLAAWAVRRVLH